VGYNRYMAWWCHVMMLKKSFFLEPHRVCFCAVCCYFYCHSIFLLKPVFKLICLLTNRADIVIINVCVLYSVLNIHRLLFELYVIVIVLLICTVLLHLFSFLSNMY